MIQVQVEGDGGDGWRQNWMGRSSDYSSTPKSGGKIVIDGGRSIEARMAEYRGPKGRERWWGSWEGAASPLPTSQGVWGSAVIEFGAFCRKMTRLNIWLLYPPSIRVGVALAPAAPPPRFPRLWLEGDWGDAWRQNWIGRSGLRPVLLLHWER